MVIILAIVLQWLRIRFVFVSCSLKKRLFFLRIKFVCRGEVNEENDFLRFLFDHLLNEQNDLGKITLCIACCGCYFDTVSVLSDSCLADSTFL